jgi:hypothetical protein
MTDITERLRLRTDPSQMLMSYPARPAPDMLCYEAADEIENLRKQIAVMKVEKSLADACLTSGYVRQTFETGTGDFSKFKGMNDG